MHCNIKNCTGEYQEGTITHTVRKQGQVIVIDHVPARPDATVPLYEYKAS